MNTEKERKKEKIPETQFSFLKNAKKKFFFFGFSVQVLRTRFLGSVASRRGSQFLIDAGNRFT